MDDAVRSGNVGLDDASIVHQRGKVRLHTHPGVEFIYVLRGKLGLHIRSDEHQLSGNDSVYFDSILPHGYRRVGRQPCAALVVTLP